MESSSSAPPASAARPPRSWQRPKVAPTSTTSGAAPRVGPTPAFRWSGTSLAALPDRKRRSPQEVARAPLFIAKFGARRPVGKDDRDPGGPLGRPLPSPGLAYAAERLARTAFPKLTITPPAPGIRFERDVAVPMRDGVRL